MHLWIPKVTPGLLTLVALFTVAEAQNGQQLPAKLVESPRLANLLRAIETKEPVRGGSLLQRVSGQVAVDRSGARRRRRVPGFVRLACRGEHSPRRTIWRNASVRAKGTPQARRQFALVFDRAIAKGSPVQLFLLCNERRAGGFQAHAGPLGGPHIRGRLRG